MCILISHKELRRPSSRGKWGGFPCEKGGYKTRALAHVKRGSSPLRNNCEKSWIFGILEMTFMGYAKDDVNNISSFKCRCFSSKEYATMCTTFHSCQHIVIRKNHLNFIILNIKYIRIRLGQF